MRRVHAVANGTPETVEEDLAVMPRRVRRSLLNQLAEGERIIVRTRQSPQVLLQDAGWPLLALAVWVFLVAKVGVTPQLSDVVFVAFLVASARLVWKEAQRRYSWFVATNRRVLKHSGIIIHKVPMMLLRKVTDMTYSRSLLGQIGGYGTILFESAGQQQAIRELTFVPDPDAVAQALNAEIYGTRPRRSTTSRDRSWPRLPRRPRRGGAGPDTGSGGPEDPGGDGGPPRGRGP
ncbi:PH domain-containing protein, partial [Phycicoccus flavus]